MVVVVRRRTDVAARGKGRVEALLRPGTGMIPLKS